MKFNGMIDSTDVDAPHTDPRAWAPEGMALLDAAADRIENGDIRLGMDEVVLGLRHLRDTFDADRWNRFVREGCREHRIVGLLHEDPFTRRSFTKPRGYAGDAEMLDFIFAPDSVPPETSPIGRAIFGYTTDGPAPRSLRARAAIIAGAIDRMAERAPLRVLAVMAGHLREARLSRAVAAGAIEKYIAFDQDASALGFIDDARYGPGIATYQGTLRSMLRGKSVFRNFDLVYTGVCDNLSDASALQLVGSLTATLAPGGTLLLSNFAPDLVDAGYMEAFMDWRLVYRDEERMERLVASLPPDTLASHRTFRDPHGNIVMVEGVRG